LKASIGGWLTAGGNATVGGSGSGSIGAGADLTVVLASGSISGLSAFIGGSAFGSLDVGVQAGLHACAAGGVAGSLSASIHASLSSWISGTSCPLDDDLKASLGLWLEGTLGAGVEAAGSVSAYGYSTVGATIAG
jgi:hypothetical protein